MLLTSFTFIPHKFEVPKVPLPIPIPKKNRNHYPYSLVQNCNLQRITCLVNKDFDQRRIGEMEIPDGYAEIVVVRHGETSWNASRVLQGHLDPELNETGRQQARAVANRLSKEPKFAAVYSSDLKRATETAQIIADNCDIKEVILERELRERHLGDLQGLTIIDAQKIKPNAYKVLNAQRRNEEIPGGGESLDQLNKRCISSLQNIASQHKGKRVIVVSHGGFIREIHRKAAPNKKLEGKIQNTSINIILISTNNNNRWFIKKWGDINHLEGVSMLQGAFGGDKISG